MTRNLLDLIQCRARSVHVGFWQPPAYLCPACADAAQKDEES